VLPRAGRVAVAALLLAVPALGGCGGSSDEVALTEPTIPRAVADDLAKRARDVARLLDAGDTCGAALEAHELRQATQRAIEKGSIPDELRPPLEAAVADLQDIMCTSDTGTGTETETRTTAPTPAAPPPTAATTTTAPETTATTTTAPETTPSEATTTPGSG
jgi:hypothetical protein